MNLDAEIIKGLQAKFQFRKTKGSWLQEGTCPDCGKREVYCSAKEPKVVRCGRQDRCGWEDSVRNLLPDLFEDWSKRFPHTKENPNAAADAYLLHERGLDLRLLRGSYSQELFRDQETGQTAATVRFTIGSTVWDRIIDRPGRFEKKAHFRSGGTWRGHCWIPPVTSIEDLAKADDIWIAEGVFDATALTQVGKAAVSAMSVNVWPDHFLAQLRAACEVAGRTTRPRLIFAFDVGRAGVEWTIKHVKRAKREGWDATAAQVRPDGEGTKLDWNDLLLRHLDWKGDAERAPFGEQAFEDYLWNGAVTIAETPREKARLIADKRALASFEFRHGNRLWWARTRYDEDQNRSIEVEEIANCAFRLLYRERDEIADETNYFLQVDFPTAQDTVKARFTAAACANSGEFKKRLMAFAGMWSGTGEQLDRIMRNQTRQLKVVEPINFTGYSRAHRAWVLGDIAVREGRLIQINRENYFDLGKSAVKLRSTERMLDIQYDPDKLSFDWVADVWTAYGPKGLVALAFFSMSVFAVQIRERHKSLGFLEVTGPPGSGKSTLLEFCWKLFGRAGYEGFDPNKATPAFIARSLVKVSNLPVGLIEGGRDDDKRTGMRSFDFNELLVLYNGRSPRGTGQKSNGYETHEPPFLGSIYLMQNERIDAIPAVLERLMSMAIDKAGWSEATKEAAIRLEGWPIEDVSGTIVHIARNEAKFLPFFFERFTHHDGAMAKRVDGLVNARPIKCHSQLAAAVEALPQLFPTCRPEWVSATLALVDQMALDRQQSAGGDHPLVSDFWEKVQFLLDREQDGAHGEGKSLNQHRECDKLIAINLVEFEARCRQAGINPPPMDALKKLLRNSKSRKWLATKKVNNPAGRTVACWVFEQAPHAERLI
ncbi:toprim domain-containing protein [Sphingomonas psychrotolerans]|uniref:Toprim domain-containing protein n=1 Tax=Sphingomonas psychrotolerans TaxID=1327635 RepID=A0ABU3N311_9SPHN|nr:toprim domain-containing protein [Sphingomonas psychrotolerans]MDT8758259.1 toprim domain-containing protein [Sphingomonas psychrotolerans]